MLEILSSLGWPAAFAIVASIVTIVLGWFGYIGKNAPAKPVVKPIDNQTQLLHNRLSELKDRIYDIETEGKVLTEKFKAFQKQIDDHEKRDITDFHTMNEKLDKLTDLVIRMLQDDKL